jgi:hypothetical protein
MPLGGDLRAGPEQDNASVQKRVRVHPGPANCKSRKINFSTSRYSERRKFSMSCCCELLRLLNDEMTLFASEP